MRYGVNLPIFDQYADPRIAVELAQDAEQAGWDGFFVSDHLLSDLGLALPIGDAWSTLAAVATRTHRMRIGPLVTPLPRRRPWRVARESVAVDHLSGGRLTVGVGLGFPADADFEQFGEDGDPAVRGQKLDEGLDVLTGLWSGREFSYHGKHYSVRPSTFLPAPLQSPRIPVWVAGVWPRPRPFRRAARWDGVVPMGEGLTYGEMMTPAALREVTSFISSQRLPGEPFDIVHWGLTPTGGSRVMDQYARAGATWWLETLAPWAYGWQNTGPWPVEMMSRRIRQGPR
jgi:alkanesulfonate monooxygenase SsuD/methylene tetrahydromethanopterin reductase-like flavin-dependent oxidoreductase (luciferase family)